MDPVPNTYIEHEQIIFGEHPPRSDSPYHILRVHVHDKVSHRRPVGLLATARTGTEVVNPQEGRASHV